MQSVWIVLTVVFMLWVAWHVGKGERKAGPAPRPVYPVEKRRLFQHLRWRREDAGRFGEFLLMELISRRLEPGRFAMLHDTWLHVRRGGTTQIDCIVVTEGAVFVVEAKYWDCLVDGSPEAERWRFVYGRKVVYDGNPRLQNQGHIADLRENFGWNVDWNLRSIVAYADKTRFARPLPPDVMHFSEVPDYIERIAAQRRGDPLDVAAVAAAIRRKSDAVTPEERAAHVENLHKRGERLRNL